MSAINPAPILCGSSETSMELAAPRPAVFLDRDGTLIEDVPYLSDPARVRLLPGSVEAVRQLHAAGFACVIVTNQSAIGRGMMTEVHLHQVHKEMVRQLGIHGVGLDGFYYCPEAPSSDSKAVVEHEDRKPGPGMLRRAAREMGLELGASWMVGDKLGDVMAGWNAGCRGSIRVRTGQGMNLDEDPASLEFLTADNILAAADLILGSLIMSEPFDLCHCPQSGRDRGSVA